MKNIITNVRKNFIPIAVFAISAFALYLRLLKLLRHNLWCDEMFQLEIMNGSFFDLLKKVPLHEYCSYLSGDFYLTYPFFKLFAYNKWGLAIPHIISTILGFYLLYFVCKRYFKTIWAYLITFIVVCFNANLIWHATEIRAYAVLPTLAIATFYLFESLFEQNIQMSTKKKWAIGSFFVLVIWFHLYGILMFFLCAIYFFLIKIRDKSYGLIFKRMIKFLLIVLFFAMPLWLVSVFGRHQEAGPDLRIDTFQYIPNPLKDIFGFLKAIFGNLVGYKKFYFLLAGLLFPFFIPYKKRLYQITFLVINIFVPIGIIFLADLKNSYYFVQRQFIWVMPLFAFFLGWSWDSLLQHFADYFPKKKFLRL